ncbi:VOC family protein [Streptomyces sp. NPDC026659]|uniref:VOC family protein n=1 Tax=Streptomyces sp. NPDC026659 TaxID=3155123 RepID=UPI0033C95ADE
MSSLIRHITVDCADPYVLATFWAGALGGSLADDDFPGDPEAVVTTATAALLFVRSDERKTVKNRVHLDLQPQDRTRNEEVERLLSLGATLQGDHRRPDGSGWVTLLDPEGNEFCVERGAEELAADRRGC